MTHRAFFESTPDDLRVHCEEHGLPSYTATQLVDWVYAKGVIAPDAMTNVSRAHRDVIARTLAFETGSLLEHQIATDGTNKLLVGWPRRDRVEDAPLAVLDNGRGRETECVMIPTEKRRTACISSQIGCPVGCRFCASGLGGLDGNLTTAQMVEQVVRLGRLPSGRITNVVFMGMGEPLANFDAVTGAIRMLNADWGLDIGARRITISTVGLPRAIRRLVDFEIPVTLALSLHAPVDDLRRELIPWAEFTTIEDLLEACHEYFRKTGREITLEYLLLRGVNDRPEHARELARVCQRLRANVNLIRYNEVKGLPYDRPTTEDVRTFQATLKRHRVNAHIRASRGRDIAAACGQLRHERT